MSRPASFGLWLAFGGTMVLTLDAMFMRLSQLTGLQMTE